MEGDTSLVARHVRKWLQKTAGEIGPPEGSSRLAADDRATRVRRRQQQRMVCAAEVALRYRRGGVALATGVLLAALVFGGSVHAQIARTGHLRHGAPGGGSYALLLAAVESVRTAFGARLQQDSAGRAQIIRSARTYVIETLRHKLFPAWYDTPWSFNGTARYPGAEPIACGFFVTRILQDIGLRIDGNRLARLASETMIRNLVAGPRIFRYVNRSAEAVQESIRALGEGIYVAGLDSHTGFVVASGESMLFVHASYYSPPLAVIAEPLAGNNPFSHSRYRVLGALFDDEMITRWAQGQPPRH